MSDRNFCIGCDLFETCEHADNVNFCDNCKDSDICDIRNVSCDEGHDIECNNGYEEDEIEVPE
jgi:hypothetical protein